MSNPDPVTGDDIRGLREDTQGLAHSIDEFATKKELDHERDNRRWAMLVAALIAVIFLGGGLYVRGVADDARAAVKDVVANRTESRIAVCENDNHFIENHNKLVDANLQAVNVLVSSATAGRVETPEQQARIDKFVADTDALFDAARVPMRDCSPAAIELFYKSKGNK
jgi:hypothetical protein